MAAIIGRPSQARPATKTRVYSPLTAQREWQEDYAAAAAGMVGENGTINYSNSFSNTCAIDIIVSVIFIRIFEHFCLREGSFLVAQFCCRGRPWRKISWRYFFPMCTINFDRQIHLSLSKGLAATASFSPTWVLPLRVEKVLKLWVSSKSVKIPANNGCGKHFSLAHH